MAAGGSGCRFGQHVLGKSTCSSQVAGMELVLGRRNPALRPLVAVALRGEPDRELRQLGRGLRCASNAGLRGGRLERRRDPFARALGAEREMPRLLLPIVDSPREVAMEPATPLLRRRRVHSRCKKWVREGHAAVPRLHETRLLGLVQCGSVKELDLRAGKS